MADKFEAIIYYNRQKLLKLKKTVFTNFRKTEIESFSEKN